MTAVSTKEHLARMAAEELEELLQIIGDISYVGYKISLCKIYGNSYMQCAIRFGIDRETARRLWAKCVEKQHDKALIKIFGIK
jgi:hypothetical protein